MNTTLSQRSIAMQAQDHQHRTKIGPTDGDHVRFGNALGTRRMLTGSQTGGGFGLVEHDLPPKQLGSPIHTHEHEDEYSYVLAGRITAQIGDEVVEAGPGGLVGEPRGLPPALLNARDQPPPFL